MKKLTVLLLCLALLGACAAPLQDGPEPLIVSQTEELVALLAEHGFALDEQYWSQEITRHTHLEVYARYFRNAEDIFIGITVYEFASTEDAQRNANFVQPNGLTIERPSDDIHRYVTSISFISQPHWFLHDTMIVRYVGSNAEFIDVLTEVLGEHFAGHGIVNPR
ncbi:MAG: hypothetical protein FWB76_01365 [Oscillospiraceae bacterium]|nr:hypothetical protein [Oscillospiraceae bacterium]